MKRRNLVRRQAAVLLAAVLAGCSTSPTSVLRENLERERFTRVNVRPEGTRIRSSGFLAVPDVIPLGKPARISLYSETEIRLTVAGLDFTMVPLEGQRFPTEAAAMDRLLAQYFVDSSAEVDADKLGPPELKDKVLAGQRVVGMTKEQVYACLGPPYRIEGGGTPEVSPTADTAAKPEVAAEPEVTVKPKPTVKPDAERRPAVETENRPAMACSYQEILASDHWIYVEGWVLGLWILGPDLVHFYFGDGRLQKETP